MKPCLAAAIVFASLTACGPGAPADPVIQKTMLLIGTVQRGDWGTENGVRKDVLSVQTPAGAQQNKDAKILKIENNQARWASVHYGVISHGAIEIQSRLKVGDQVILTDMSQYDTFERLRVR